MLKYQIIKKFKTTWDYWFPASLTVKGDKGTRKPLARLNLQPHLLKKGTEHTQTIMQENNQTSKNAWNYISW